MVWIISPAVSYLRAGPHKREGWDFTAAKKYLVVDEERAHKPQIFLMWHFNHHPPYPTVCVERVTQVLFIQLAFKLPIFNWFWTNINHNACLRLQKGQLLKDSETEMNQVDCYCLIWKNICVQQKQSFCSIYVCSTNSHYAICVTAFLSDISETTVTWYFRLVLFPK